MTHTFDSTDIRDLRDTGSELHHDLFQEWFRTRVQPTGGLLPTELYPVDQTTAPRQAHADYVHWFQERTGNTNGLWMKQRQFLIRLRDQPGIREVRRASDKNKTLSLVLTPVPCP